MALINDAIDRGTDPRQLARQIVDYLRALLLIQMNNPDLLDQPDEQSAQMADHATRLDRGRILTGIKAFSKVASERRTTWQSSLPLELALLEIAGQVDQSTSPRQAESAGNPSQVGSEQVDPNKTLDQSENPTPKNDVARIKSASPPPELAGTITFERVLGNWSDVLQAARSQDPRVQALLNSCRPLGLENGALIIGFSSDLLREKMEKEHNLRIAINALEQTFGDRLVLRCVLTESWQTGDVESIPPPMADQGMVATALRELGAQVVDVERLPGDSTSGDSTG
jgi:DNA polymerase-3 subunit gamma/tau